jgi:hypothetical protein
LDELDILAPGFQTDTTCEFKTAHAGMPMSSSAAMRLFAGSSLERILPRKRGRDPVACQCQLHRERLSGIAVSSAISSFPRNAGDAVGDWGVWRLCTPTSRCEGVLAIGALSIRGIYSIGEQRTCDLMALPGRLEWDVGMNSQGKRLVFAVESVVVAPIPTAVWHH